MIAPVGELAVRRLNTSVQRVFVFRQDYLLERNPPSEVGVSKVYSVELLLDNSSCSND
jgi:hypothetical protein